MEIETLLRRKYGFEGMTLERRREIAALGGRTAHQKGRAYEWTSEKAREAGKIGGRISKRRPRQATGN